MSKLNGHDISEIAKAVGESVDQVPPDMWQQLRDLDLKRSEMIVEVVCRSTGRTDWTLEQYKEVLRDRGRLRPYDDGSAVFVFDGEDKLLFHPITELLPGQLGQKVEYLYNRRDFDHHTAEDEKG